MGKIEDFGAPQIPTDLTSILISIHVPSKSCIGELILQIEGIRGHMAVYFKTEQEGRDA